MYDRIMLAKILMLSTVCAAVLLAIIFQTTTPASIHPLGILFIFVLLYVLALGVLTFLTYHVMRLCTRIGKGDVKNVSFHRTYVLSLVLALAPVICLGIQSVGNLTAYEIFLVILFEIFACFYVVKRR